MAPINNSWKLPGTIDLVCRVFVPRDSLKAAFGVMVADRGVAFGHGDSYGERKG